jgi:integrase
MTADYGAATISRDVSVLHAIFATAKREELVESNPAERAERPKLPRRSWRILSEDSVRSIALSPRLVEALSGHYARTAYKGDGELVFCHPDKGSMYGAERFVEALGKALRAAGITDHLRAFHDLRHTCITNDAAAGASPIAVMAKAGHANMRTTQTYLHLAGVVFRDEAARLENRLLAAELSTEVSTRLSEPEPTSDDLSRMGKPETVG